MKSAKTPTISKLPEILRKVDAEMLTDGILIRKEPLYESLVDQDYLRRVGRVLICESASSQDGHAHGIEKLGADTVPCRAALIARPGGRMPLLNHALAPVVSFERTVEGHTHMGDAGQCREALFNLTIKTGKPVEGVARSGRIR